MVYRRKERDAWFVAVPTPHGRVKRSTGTTHRPTAVAMERMLVALGPKGRRAWDLIERVVDGTLTLGTLYDTYATTTSRGSGRGSRTPISRNTSMGGWRGWPIGLAPTLARTTPRISPRSSSLNPATLDPDSRDRRSRADSLRAPRSHKSDSARRKGLGAARIAQDSRSRVRRGGKVPRRGPVVRDVPRRGRRAAVQPATGRPGATTEQAARRSDRVGRRAASPGARPRSLPCTVRAAVRRGRRSERCAGVR